ncbi:hypothetical protein CAMRE0001_1218 [Campylobacter rectus RM3267]|uniref:Uncharacterized protein n=1 Tax=Campylobacter rectus RM3267 TaxID=553218 RepID=B9D0L1_CAMRE|nr:hypothetical protein CAMRE0001_1218 [Campylobacter rectus RM3267]
MTYLNLNKFLSLIFFSSCLNLLAKVRATKMPTYFSILLLHIVS